MTESKYPEYGIVFQADLYINKVKLDEELMCQAQKMMAYSKAHAQAQYDRDQAKRNLDIVKAGEDSRVRAELTASGTKFTEAVVDGRIRTSPAYLEAQDAHIKAEYKVNLLLGGVMAMNARRPMLESLVRLLMSEWWAEPRVRGGEGMKADAGVRASGEAIMRRVAYNPEVQSMGVLESQTTDRSRKALGIQPKPALAPPPPGIRPAPRPTPIAKDDDIPF